MTIRSMPYKTFLFFVTAALAALVGCGAETAESEADEPEPAAGTAEQAATGRHNCGSIGPGNIDAFRGSGQCCKTTYNIRGEAGGWCARNIGNVNNMVCRYEVYFAGGWGPTNGGRRQYTGYCSAY